MTALDSLKKRAGVLVAGGVSFALVLVVMRWSAGDPLVQPKSDVGVLIGLNWVTALAFAAVWLGVAFLTRFSSLAALTAAVVVPVFLYFLGHRDMALLFLIMTAIVYYKHRANIERLLAGTEGRIGAKE